RPLRLAWHGDDAHGHARTKFAAFAPGRYRRTPGLMPSRTDFRAGTLTGYVGHQMKASAAARAMVDYALGRQEENADLIIFHADRLELRAHRRKHCTLMLDGEILRMNFPLNLRILP